MYGFELIWCYCFGAPAPNRRTPRRIAKRRIRKGPSGTGAAFHLRPVSKVCHRAAVGVFFLADSN